jgi:cell wall assembly regulator SMI1
MEHFREAVRIITANPDLNYFSGPKPEALVRKAEAALGLVFPPTYREFLLQYGAGGFGGSDFCGVSKDDFVNSSWPDGIWMTLQTRQRWALPHSYIIVSNDGMGDDYCIDTADGNGRIVLFQPGLSLDHQVREVVAEDFGEFFLQIITRYLGYARAPPEE